MQAAGLGQPARVGVVGVPAGEITRQDKSLGLLGDLAAGIRPKNPAGLNFMRRGKGSEMFSKPLPQKQGLSVTARLGGSETVPTEKV